jgi:hypothetical protein
MHAQNQTKRIVLAGNYCVREKLKLKIVELALMIILVRSCIFIFIFIFVLHFLFGEKVIMAFFQIYYL